jgi:hypothetical protein
MSEAMDSIRKLREKDNFKPKPEVKPSKNTLRDTYKRKTKVR